MFHGKMVNMYCISQYQVEWDMPYHSTFNSTLSVRLVQEKHVTVRTLWNVEDAQEGFYFCQGSYNNYGFFSFTSLYVISKLQEYSN